MMKLDQAAERMTQLGTECFHTEPSTLVMLRRRASPRRSPRKNVASRQERWAGGGEQPREEERDGGALIKG